MHVFFFNDTATTEIYTLSLHDALPIFVVGTAIIGLIIYTATVEKTREYGILKAIGLSNRRLYSLVFQQDRKSTRLNSSHANISYAVFCLKKNKIIPLLPVFYTHLSCIY